MANLIIVAGLIDPPTDTLAFRNVTYWSKKYFHFYNLIEIEKEFTDIYYHYSKKMGLLDYVDQFVDINEEYGLRLDTNFNYSKTLKIPYIKYENQLSILGQVKFLI